MIHPCLPLVPQSHLHQQSTVLMKPNKAAPAPGTLYLLWKSNLLRKSDSWTALINHKVALRENKQWQWDQRSNEIRYGAETYHQAWKCHY